jgi:hypothetical protein
MFVGEQNAMERIWRDADEFEFLGNFTRAQTSVYEHPCGGGFHERTIS